MSRLWYDARDTFLGMNYKVRCMAKGVEMARQCQEDDAKWLCSVFPEEPPHDTQSAYHAILASEDTPRAKCYAALLVHNRDLLLDAAKLGYPLAIVESHYGVSATIPSLERNMYALRGHQLRHQNAVEAAKHYIVAAELGHVISQHYLALCYTEACQKRYYWLAEAMDGGRSEATMDFSCFMRDAYRTDCKPTMFLIGEQLTYRKHCMTGSILAIILRNHYLSVSQRATRAINTWLMVAKWLGVVRDIRNVVAKMLWKQNIDWI